MEESPPTSPAKIFTSSPLASSQPSEPPTDKIKEDEDEHSSSREQQILSGHESHSELHSISPDDLPPSSPPPYSSSPCEVLSCGVVAESTITIEPEADPAIQVDNEQTPSLASMSPIKRKRGEENTDLGEDECDSKRSKPAHISPPSRLMPTTKRPTAASQILQHKKLTTPFRSPLMKKPIVSAIDSPTPDKVIHSSNPPNIIPPLALLPIVEATSTEPVATKNRTKRAAAQFKSPLAPGSANAISAVRLTPTIQAMERKVQLLKRALKVKTEGEEETLVNLVKKWTEAGREAAYELWGLVKDMGDGGRKEGWNGNGSWGWAGYDELNPVKGRKEKEASCEEEERHVDTLGTMLKQLGIMPLTLGWNEEEEVFMDM